VTEVTVVIPAYREENLEKTVKDLRTALAPHDHEILIVTDHPKEPTTDEARRIANANVRHVSLPEPRGKGGAILAGFQEARGDVVGFVDADGAVSPRDVEKLVRVAKQAGGSIGSRNVEGSRVGNDRSLTRRIASRAFNIYVKALFGLPYNDTQCGAKFFKREPLKEVIPEIWSTGFEFDVELLWKLRNRNVRIVEVPVEWEHSDESTFSLTEGPGMLKNLLTIRFRQNT